MTSLDYHLAYKIQRKILPTVIHPVNFFIKPYRSVSIMMLLKVTSFIMSATIILYFLYVKNILVIIL